MFMTYPTLMRSSTVYRESGFNAKTVDVLFVIISYIVHYSSSFYKAPLILSKEGQCKAQANVWMSVLTEVLPCDNGRRQGIKKDRIRKEYSPRCGRESFLLKLNANANANESPRAENGAIHQNEDLVKQTRNKYVYNLRQRGQPVVMRITDEHIKYRTSLYIQT